MRHCPNVRFYLYTRSWRVEGIAEVLEQMAALRCCRVWYSIDRETGVPAKVPIGVRLAYLQVDKDEQPELLDLLFVVRRVRRDAVRVVCPCCALTRQTRLRLAAPVVAAIGKTLAPSLRAKEPFFGGGECPRREKERTQIPLSWPSC